MFHLTPSESHLDQSLLTCFESLPGVAASEFRFNGMDALHSTRVPGVRENPVNEGRYLHFTLPK